MSSGPQALLRSPSCGRFEENQREGTHRVWTEHTWSIYSIYITIDLWTMIAWLHDIRWCETMLIDVASLRWKANDLRGPLNLGIFWCWSCAEQMAVPEQISKLWDAPLTNCMLLDVMICYYTILQHIIIQCYDMWELSIFVRQQRCLVQLRDLFRIDSVGVRGTSTGADRPLS